MERRRWNTGARGKIILSLLIFFRVMGQDIIRENMGTRRENIGKRITLDIFLFSLLTFLREGRGLWAKVKNHCSRLLVCQTVDERAVLLPRLL
jgi:hypothetical protein